MILDFLAFLGMLRMVYVNLQKAMQTWGNAVPVDWTPWLYLAAMIGVVVLVTFVVCWLLNKLTGGKIALWNSKRAE